MRPSHSRRPIQSLPLIREMGSHLRPNPGQMGCTSRRGVRSQFPGHLPFFLPTWSRQLPPHSPVHLSLLPFRTLAKQQTSGLSSEGEVQMHSQPL